MLTTSICQRTLNFNLMPVKSCQHLQAGCESELVVCSDRYRLHCVVRDRHSYVIDHTLTNDLRIWDHVEP